MYHRFHDPASLRRQLSYLKATCNPISLTELTENLTEGRSLDDFSVVVTVDDGYRDFLEVAYPEFTAFDIPVTVFLVTDFIDGKSWLWGDRVRYAFERTARLAVAVELPPAGTLHFTLDSKAKRVAASDQVKEAVKRISDRDRLRLLERLHRSLEVDVPETAPPEYAPMTWDQIRPMAAAGVEFGAHTRSHPVLSRILDPAEIREEILGSRVRIESELGRPPAHFCYSNGRKGDWNQIVTDAVREAGFRSAVSAEPGLIGPSADLFALPRIGVDPSYPEPYFRRCVAGIRV